MSLRAEFTELGSLLFTRRLPHSARHALRAFGGCVRNAKGAQSDDSKNSETVIY